MNGDRYYGYVGLGTGFGGFSASPNISYSLNGSHNAQFNINNGIAVGGFAGLLQMQFGAEWRFVNKFYIAVEGSGNIAFNQISQISSTGELESGGNHSNIFISSRYGQGSNAFAGLYVNTKLGWTDPTDSIAFYFLFGVGYEFSPATLTVARGDSNGNASIYAQDFEMGGFRLRYGVGASYYFNENFGIYCQFVLTSPIPQSHGLYNPSYVETGKNPPDARKLDPEISGPFSSYSYIVNLGLVVRF